MASKAEKTTLRWLTTDNSIGIIENKTLEEVYDLFADFAEGDDGILQSLIAILMTLISCRIAMSFPDDLCKIHIDLDSSYPEFENALAKAYEKVEQNFLDYTGDNKRLLQVMFARFIPLLAAKADVHYSQELNIKELLG